jgi:hypothetical protein
MKPPTTANRTAYNNFTVNVLEHGARGDGTTDDTPYILEAIDRASRFVGNRGGGEVRFPPGEYLVTDQISIPYNVTLSGDGKGEFLQAYGASTIASSYDGQAVLVEEGRYGWGIRDLVITGDRTLASQDLLTIGEGNNALPALAGTLERVYLSQAGRDCLVLDDALHVHAVDVYCHKAKRYGLRTAGQSNAHKFTKCQFREADQWGVYWGGGMDAHFDACTFESNSAHASTAYGGLKIDPNDADVAANISLLMTACHFEENSGFDGNARPIRVEPGGRTVSVTEVGTVYTETEAGTHCSVEAGPWTAVGIVTNLTTHMVLATDTAEPVVFVNPQQLGVGTFALNDISGTAQVFGLGFWEAPEITDPAAPATNHGRLYFRDNGAGKTQVVARFPTGAIQVIATEP